MKSMKNYRIYFLLYFVVISCNRKEFVYNKTIEITENSDKIIELDSESSFELLNIQLIIDQDLFLTLDAIRNNINIFNWSEGNLIKKIPLNIDEQNNIFTPTKFYFHNFDSIFLIDYGKNIKLINQNGEIINGYDVGEIKSKNNEYQGIYGYIQLSNNKKFIYDNNKIIYSTEHLLSDENSLGIFNLQKNQIEETIKTPYATEQLFENDFTDLWYDHDKTTNTIFISFPLTNSIYKYNLDLKSFKELKNPYINHSFDEHYNIEHTDIRYSNLHVNRIDTILKKLNSLERYTSIWLTDNYIVRLFIHQSKDPGEKARDFTIYIYSKNGELLREKFFQNPTIDNETLLVSNAEDFIFTKNDTIFISYLNSKPDENKILFKSFIITDNIIY
jgi:hypothetical protein